MLHTIGENAIGSHRNADQSADVIEHGTPVTMALGIVDECANVNAFRGISNARTNGDRYVIWVEAIWG